MRIDQRASGLDRRCQPWNVDARPNVRGWEYLGICPKRMRQFCVAFEPPTLAFVRGHLIEAAKIVLGIDVMCAAKASKLQDRAPYRGVRRLDLLGRESFHNGVQAVPDSGGDEAVVVPGCARSGVIRLDDVN